MLYICNGGVVPMQDNMAKAVALLSGGLDSTLALKMIQDQGIETFAIHFTTIFCTCNRKSRTCMEAVRVAGDFGVPLKVFDVTAEYMAIVERPKHGRGRNMNPCIDCRIFTFRKAREYMYQSGASFVVTGEVLGERPMSQRLDAMRLIEKESGLSGLIVRPLCARLLDESIPEKEGWVDRQKFLEISGRSRKPQIQLASELGIRDYPCASGGCLLTDAGFSNRLKDIFAHPGWDLNDIYLLKVGRHFRLGPNLKLIVGRNEAENQKLSKLASKGDLILKAADFPGPTSILRGAPYDGQLACAASIVARYSDANGRDKIRVYYKSLLNEVENFIMVEPTKDEALKEMRI